MALDPATIDAMVAAGLSAEQIAAVVKAELIAEQTRRSAAEEERKARARDGNRERQARFRERRNASNADNAVTHRDETLPPKSSPTPPKTTPQEITPSVPNGTSAPKGADRQRGKRIPDGFEHSPEARQAAADFGFVGDAADEVLAEFADYWRPLPGSKAAKLDWVGTLRNRLREVSRRRPSARASPAARPRASNGFFDVLRDDLSETDERSSAPQQQYPRLIAGARH